MAGFRVVPLGHIMMLPGAAVSISTEPAPSVPAKPPRY